jgi:hypothetical protein
MTIRLSRVHACASAVTAAAAFLAVIAVVGSGCTGDGAEYGCPSLRSCGGDPTGAWKATSWCDKVIPSTFTNSEQGTTADGVFAAQNQPQSPTLAKPSGPVTSSGNWCESLIYSPPNPNNPVTTQLPTNGAITSLSLYHPNASVTGLTLNFLADHSYQASATTNGPAAVHFDNSCLTAYGANPSCSDLGTQLHQFYFAMPNFQNIVCCSTGSVGDDAGNCPADSRNGCDCTYTYAGTAADEGIWRVVGSTLYLTSTENPTVQLVEASFCADRSNPNMPTLTISGFNGFDLDGVNGFRTATMVPLESSSGN